MSRERDVFDEEFDRLYDNSRKRDKKWRQHSRALKKNWHWNKGLQKNDDDNELYYGDESI